MGEGRKSPPDGRKPANDNRPFRGEAEEGDFARQQRMDRVDRLVLSIAQLIGRGMAREDFKARHAANDNGPRTAGHVRDGDDQD